MNNGLAGFANTLSGPRRTKMSKYSPNSGMAGTHTFLPTAYMYDYFIVGAGGGGARVADGGTSGGHAGCAGQILNGTLPVIGPTINYVLGAADLGSTIAQPIYSSGGTTTLGLMRALGGTSGTGSNLYSGTAQVIGGAGGFIGGVGAAAVAANISTGAALGTGGGLGGWGSSATGAAGGAPGSNGFPMIRPGSSTGGALSGGFGGGGGGGDSVVGGGGNGGSGDAITGFPGLNATGYGGGGGGGGAGGVTSGNGGNGSGGFIMIVEYYTA